MRDRQAYHNRLVISANKMEPALNEVQPPDTLFYVDQSNLAEYGRRAEKDVVLAGGPAEPERLFYLGHTTGLPFSVPKAQPQHIAFLGAFGLGSCSTVAAGSGYLHTIKPLDTLDDHRDLPTFTAVQRLGNIVEQRLLASLAVDSFNISASRDDWLKISAQFKGTGKTQSDLDLEEVAGNSDDATIALAANAVEGASAQARLDSVHRVLFKLTGQEHYTPVQVTAVDASTPAQLSITPPDASGANAGSYQVTYAPDAATALDTGSATSDPVYDYANDQSTLADTIAAMTVNEHAGRWLVMTSGIANGAMFQITSNTATELVLADYDLYTRGVRSGDTYKVVGRGWLPINQNKVDEPPLRCHQIQVFLGGAWNGAAFLGGYRVGNQANSLTYNVANNLDPAFLFGDHGHASQMDRGERTQTLSLDRRMMDAAHRAWLEAGAGGDTDEAKYFGVRILAEGPEYESGQTYMAEIIFPKVGLQDVKPTPDGKKLAETLEMAVLSHEVYGSVIINVRNKVATYAA